jgi:photosystem II stability/assembly factor-like uncharacterized protein
MAFRLPMPRIRSRARVLRAALVGACMLGALGASGVVSADPVIVTFDVSSHTTVTDECTGDPARYFGTVQPGTPALTDRDAGACRIRFSASSSGASLRIRQAAGIGDAMTTGAVRTTLRWAPRMSDVEALNANTVLAIHHSQGRVHRTTDGGNTWTTSNYLGWGNLHKADAADTTNTSRVWMTTMGGRIAYSPDGGVTWSSQFVNNLLDLSPVVAFSSSIALAFGSDNTMVRTNNGGGVWTSTTTLQGSPRIRDAANASSTVGWLVGSNGMILKTIDAGATWTPQNSNTAVNLRGIAAVSATEAWAVGDSGTVLRTVNGVDWNPVTHPLTATMFYAVGVSGSNVYVSGPCGGCVMHSDNSGGDWTVQYIADAIGNEIAAVGSRAWIANESSSILRTMDAGTTWDTPFSTGSSIQSIAAPQVGTIWTAGEHGRIERTINDGGSWTEFTTPTTQHLNGLALDAPRAWAVGNAGTIITTADDGATWIDRTATSGTSLRLAGVASFGQGTLVAVGDTGTIVRSTDNGATWVSVTSGTSVRLRAVAAAGTNGWAVGDSGTVLRTTDRGATWTVSNPGGSTTLRTVAAVNDQVAWFAGHSGMIRRTTDGGATWVTIPSPTGSAITAISAQSTILAWVGSGATVWSTASAGASWRQAGQVAGANFYAIQSIDATRAYAAGIGNRVERITPAASIPDYATGAWSGSGGMFGACLQSLAGGAAPDAWPVDGAGTPNRCEMSDADPWRALPLAPLRIAQQPTAGVEGIATLVFGVRPQTAATPGSYSATIVFEVVSP